MPLGVASSEDAGDVLQDIGGRFVVVAKVSDEARLDDVDLLLSVSIHDV